MDFSKRLKEIRSNQNLKQKDIYNQMNISQNGYASWEQGRTEPNLQSLIKLSKIFKVSTDYLLGLENEEGYIVMNNELSEDENYLIDVVRQLSQKDKTTLYELAELMLKVKQTK